MGKTSDGKELINVDHVRNIVPMVQNDFECVEWVKELVVEALRKTNNNVDATVMLLTGQRYTIENAAELRVHERRAREKHVLSLVNMGFDIDLVTFALKLLDNNVERACSALLEGKVPYPKIKYEQPAYWYEMTPPSVDANQPTSNIFNLPQEGAVTENATQTPLTEQVINAPPLDLERLDQEFLEQQQRDEIKDTIDNELVDVIRSEEQEIYDSDLVDELAIIQDYLTKL
jgi:hypothetical protein